VLHVGAQAKWDELDMDGSGSLEGDEVAALAEWVWCSMRGDGEEITSKGRLREAASIIERCDTNGDGSIDAVEFVSYYDEVLALGVNTCVFTVPLAARGG